MRAARSARPSSRSPPAYAGCRVASCRARCRGGRSIVRPRSVLLDGLARITTAVRHGHQRRDASSAADLVATVASLGRGSSYRPAPARSTCRTGSPRRRRTSPPRRRPSRRPSRSSGSTQNHPAQCQTCHQQIFDEWNGSMMSNSWRDPVWRAAFLLLARGDVDQRRMRHAGAARRHGAATHNPFAAARRVRVVVRHRHAASSPSRAPGSLLDAFCSRCHMPTNYVDNVPLRNVKVDPRPAWSTARVDPKFNPTVGQRHRPRLRDRWTRSSATPSRARPASSASVCHSFAATRDTPFHNYARGGTDATSPASDAQPRTGLAAAERRDLLRRRRSDQAQPRLRDRRRRVPAVAARHRLPRSARPAARPTQRRRRTTINYQPASSGSRSPYQQMDASKHKGLPGAPRARRDVRRLPRRHQRADDQEPRSAAGSAASRSSAPTPSGRAAATPTARATATSIRAFKRDCQSCHMQQDYGQPGTAQTLYKDGTAAADRRASAVATDGKPRPSFTPPLRRRQRAGAAPDRQGRRRDPATSRPTPSCRRSASRRPTTRARTRAASGRNAERKGAVRAAGSGSPGIACATCST